MKKKFPEYYCEESFVNVIMPIQKIKTDESKEWLIIGWPGVDGIEFRVKNVVSDNAVYAYYPIEDEHIKIAESAEELIEKWKTGELTV